MKPKLRKFGCIPVFLAALAFASPVNAQEQSQAQAKTATGQEYRHILRGHVFSPSLLIPQAFSNSQVLVANTLGQANIPYANPLGQTLTLDLGAFSPVMAAQVNVLHDLAITFGINANVIAGLDTASGLNYGGSSSYALNLGFIYELIRTENAVLSVAFSAYKPHSFSVSPLQSVVSAIQGALTSGSPDVVRNSVEWQFRPSLRLAYAVNPVFGLRSLLGASVDSLVSGSPDSVDSNLLLDLGLEVNFDPVFSVPVALEGDYLRGQIIVGGNNSDIFSVGLYETFARAFNVGFNFGWAQSLGGSANFGVLTLRAYYN